MLKNQLKTAIRYWTKNKGLMVINILGLVFGLGSTLIIAIFVMDIRSMDSFLEKRGEIYRLEAISEEAGNSEVSASLHHDILPSIASEIPEIEAYSRIMPGAGIVVFQHDQLREVQEEEFLFVDEGFFDIFNFKLLEGRGKEILSDPKNAIITRSTARKYFNDEDPIGREMSLSNGERFLVAGIAEDPGLSSSIQFDIIASYQRVLVENTKPNFESEWFFTAAPYLRIVEGADVDLIESKVSTVLKRLTNISIVVDPEYRLSSLESLKRDMTIVDDVIQPIDARVIQVFTLVALVIILLVISNYINLSSAKSIERAKEVGIRKVVGASKYSLARQVLLESILICLISIPLIVLLVESALPYFESILGRRLAFSYSDNSIFMACFIVGILLLGVLAGVYPSILLSKLKLSDSLKGNFGSSRMGQVVRKALILLQFSLSMILVFGVILIQKQLNFVQNQTLSYNPDELIVLEGRWNQFKDDYKVVKDEMLRVAGVKQVSLSNSVPGDNSFMSRNIPEIQSPVTRYITDDDFFDIFNIELKRGEPLSFFVDTLNSNVIYNEAFARALSEDPMKMQPLKLQGRAPNKVVGVVEDFHFESLHNPIRPAYFARAELQPAALTKIILRVESREVEKIIGQIEGIWQRLYPDNVFNYQFLDQRLQTMYSSEQRISSSLKVFTFLAILISCLGLFGLSLYNSQIKLKDMSIRKVLGANVFQIAKHLNREVYIISIVSALLAVPVAYSLVSQWLNDFAYRVPINWTVFAGIFLISVLLVSLTTGWHTMKVIKTNAAKVLKEE